VCTYLTAYPFQNNASVVQLRQRPPNNPSIVNSARLLKGIHKGLLLFWLQLFVASEFFGFLNDGSDHHF
jgi:hypothetical protein